VRSRPSLPPKADIGTLAHITFDVVTPAASPARRRGQPGFKRRAYRSPTVVHRSTRLGHNPGRRGSLPPYLLEDEVVSKPPAAPATPHTVACSESFGKDSSHFKLAMSFGFRNVTATNVEANGTKVAASVIFPDDPQQRLEVRWKNATSSGTYQIVRART